MLHSRLREDKVQITHRRTPQAQRARSTGVVKLLIFTDIDIGKHQDDNYGMCESWM